jgi:hypothetical protein
MTTKLPGKSKRSRTRHIDDVADYCLAHRRLKRGGKRVPLESLDRDLKKRIRR